MHCIQTTATPLNNTYILFYFVICSFYLEKEKADKTFGFSFVSLMRADGTTVPDDTHDLCVYKVRCVAGFGTDDDDLPLAPAGA